MYQIILEFKTHLQTIGYGKTTCNMLPTLVTEFLEQQGITDIYYIEGQKVREFYEYLQSRPLKKRIGVLSEMMISHYVYALKVFFGWAEITEQIMYNPISGLKFKRPQQNQRQPLSQPQIQQLFASCESTQELAMLHLFYSCGLRRSEGENLQIRDINFAENKLYVRNGKGAKRRVVPLTDKVSDELQQYFLSNDYQKLNGNQYNNILKKLLTINNLPLTISLHHLRHSIATHLLENGMSMEFVRDFLGHSHLETTHIYAKTNSEQLKLL